MAKALTEIKSIDKMVLRRGGYNMGIGFVFLLFLVVQIGMSVVSAVAYNAIAIALCSIGVMMAIGFIL